MRQLVCPWGASQDKVFSCLSTTLFPVGIAVSCHIKLPWFLRAHSSMFETFVIPGHVTPIIPGRIAPCFEQHCCCLSYVAAVLNCLRAISQLVPRCVTCLKGLPVWSERGLSGCIGQEAWALVKSKQMPVLLWRGGETVNYTNVQAAALDWRRHARLSKLQTPNVLWRYLQVFRFHVLVDLGNVRAWCGEVPAF